MEKNINNKLKIGFSIGDFNGIGPEILLKAFYNKNLFEVCVPIVFSSRYILDYYKNKFSIDIDINETLKDSFDINLPIKSDAAIFLKSLNNNNEIKCNPEKSWLTFCKSLRNKYPIVDKIKRNTHNIGITT